MKLLRWILRLCDESEDRHTGQLGERRKAERRVRERRQ